jgi:hypothetical protein
LRIKSHTKYLGSIKVKPINYHWHHKEKDYKRRPKVGQNEQTAIDSPSIGSLLWLRCGWTLTRLTLGFTYGPENWKKRVKLQGRTIGYGWKLLGM